MSAAIPPAIQKQLTHPENAEAAIQAMKLFLAKGEKATFQQAVATYCAGACERGDEVQTVLGALCRLAMDIEGPRVKLEGVLAGPSELHSLIFAGILRAFYGDGAVDRAVGARAQRKADAPQHVQSGTWPVPPAF